MKKWFLVAALLAAVALVPQTASADTIFTFTFNGPTATGFGILDGVSSGGGQYTIASGSLTITSSGGWAGSYALIANPNAPNPATSPLGAFVYDDILLSGQPFLDSYGLLFAPKGGTSPEINIWGNGLGRPYSFWVGVGAGNYPAHDDNTQFSVSLVPEPATLSLLGLGLVGIARVARRQKK